MRKWIALAAGVAILAMVNYTIHGKEQLLTNGRTVLLQLAPVDPRSLMQGDYMSLRFKVADDAFGRGTVRDSLRDGRIVLTLDAQGTGSFARFDDGAPLGPDEVRMRYRIAANRSNSPPTRSSSRRAMLISTRAPDTASFAQGKTARRSSRDCAEKI